MNMKDKKMQKKFDKMKSVLKLLYFCRQNCQTKMLNILYGK